MELTDTVPSLFTFRIGDASLRSLMGTVAENAVVGIAGTSFRARGALLITDWGVSGPATLRLSSYAARHLAASSYTGTLVVNWTGSAQAEAAAWIEAARGEHSRKFVSSIRPDGIADRLWQHLLDKAGVRREMRWAELGGKGAARMVETLTADCYRITGRARFKEEFVTCGGVALSGVDLRTLESKVCPGLFFAGEVLDVDAVTGGFNLQAAWSTAMAVANAL